MDTIEGGKWLPNQDLAWTLVQRRIERVQELENEIGCFFDRNPDGTLHGKAFAGQTFDRTVHKGDLTGIEIINRLMEQVLGAAGASAGRAPRRRADPGERRRGALAGVLMIDVRTRRYSASCGARPCCWPPAADRPCTATTRPPATRAWTASPWRCAAACRCATWRWCSSIRPACSPAPDTRMTGTVLEEGLRGAGGYLLDGAGSASCSSYDPSWRARDARRRRRAHVCRDARRPHHAQRRASISPWATSAPTR